MQSQSCNRVSALLRVLVFFFTTSLVRCLNQTTLDTRGEVKTLKMNTSSLRTAVTISASLLSTAGLNLLVYADSPYKFEVRAGEKGNLKLKCSGSSRAVCLLSLADEQHALSSVKGYRVEFDLKCDTVCSGDFGLSVDDKIVAQSGLNYDIFTGKASQIQVDLSAVVPSGSQKLRLSLSGYTVQQSANYSSLEATGQMFEDKTTKTAKGSFPLRRLHGNEVAAVFYKNDKYFCRAAEGCRYLLSVNATNQWKLVLSTEASDRVEVINPDKNYVACTKLVRHPFALRQRPNHGPVRARGRPVRGRKQRAGHARNHRR